MILKRGSTGNYVKHRYLKFTIKILRFIKTMNCLIFLMVYKKKRNYTASTNFKRLFFQIIKLIPALAGCNLKSLMD